ncbi:PucR C-terminal helix-turn-helix domain-containing protein [Klenkia marina]|uniref:PucR C-terminal helix-turn-helix domain-containing protein n=1 Tax=Klenkia marina TaxID=1960309 RepID=A0A1G4YPC8_9ACTN|nr:helix-turn-helix domain-containing protein [Klenkia marina]SCX55307.1 PucR C-terminal helix-turn-helix domain-containing protein [Klenkia marina]
MPSDRLQQLVDSLAEQLQRSVVVDDPQVRMLATSRHFGDEDDVRVRAVLQRDAGSAAVAHVLGSGVASWRAAGWIPAAPGIGMHPRWCLPVRWHGELLGLLMVIDARGELAADDVELIEAAGTRLAAVMEGERHAATAATAATAAAVGGLLSGVPTERERALADLATTGAAPSGRHVRAVVLRATGVGPGDVGQARAAVRRGLDVLASRPGAAVLGAVDPADPTTGTGLVVTAGPLDDAATAELAGRAVAELTAVAAGRFGAVAGTGPGVRGLAEAWRSHRPAELATRAVPRLAPGPVVDGSALGVHAVLLRVPAERWDETALPPELVALRAADPEGRLTGTLAAWLDAGGRAPVAAEALHVHRTTLHYRLDRVRELTGADLDDGKTRLRLHLGLAVARLLDG